MGLPLLKIKKNKKPHFLKFLLKNKEIKKAYCFFQVLNAKFS